MYELRPHTLREYFKTRLVSAGVPESHVDYMMGHVTDTYNQIQSFGIENLRNAYTAADLRIRPKTKLSPIDRLKDIIRAEGASPEQILAREALVDNATTVVDPEERQLSTLQWTLRDMVHQQINEAVQRPG